jgi:hypothetical protein
MLLCLQLLLLLHHQLLLLHRGLLLCCHFSPQPNNLHGLICYNVSLCCKLAPQLSNEYSLLVCSIPHGLQLLIKCITLFDHPQAMHCQLHVLVQGDCPVKCNCRWVS